MRVGVLGGTFDPIHLGHLHIARHASRLFGLARIYFVVAAAPPHKRASRLRPLHHRYAMVVLATSRSSAFLPSLVELEPPASPFSSDTMAKLARHLSGAELYFIAGGDSLEDVRSWHRSEALLSSYSFVFVTRPRLGSFTAADPLTALPPRVRPRTRDLRAAPRRALAGRIARERGSRQPRIWVMDLDAPDISSSRIRSLAASGGRIRHMVPPLVDDYIRKLEIYGNP
jgi:nicotinate-nucleotide adenylyltransferase